MILHIQLQLSNLFYDLFRVSILLLKVPLDLVCNVKNRLYSGKLLGFGYQHSQLVFIAWRNPSLEKESSHIFIQKKHLLIFTPAFPQVYLLVLKPTGMILMIVTRKAINYLGKERAKRQVGQGALDVVEVVSCCRQNFLLPSWIAKLQKTKSMHRSEGGDNSKVRYHLFISQSIRQHKS